MASNFYDAYTQGLEAELARLRGELATVAKERDEAIEALRPFVMSYYSEMSWCFGELLSAVFVPPEAIGKIRKLIADYHERRRADGDVMLNPEGAG